MKVDNKITIESERSVALRRHEYFVVSHDREGNEVQVLSFLVNDNGRIGGVEEPLDLIKEKRLTDD